MMPMQSQLLNMCVYVIRNAEINKTVVWTGGPLKKNS